MKRTSIGRTLIILGWGCFVSALALPAIKYEQMGLDTFVKESKIGASCLLETFQPTNWMFAPLLAVYAFANLFMAGSPLLAMGSADTRCISGILMLLFFCGTLAVPWCAEEVHGILLGCVMWQLSFLCVGLGCIRSTYEGSPPFSER